MAIAQNYPTISPSLLLDFANVEALDSRITFARASTATYYGTRTALAEQNLLTYSQEFDNAAWTKSATTVTANSIAAPDGTTTADTISAAGTNYNAVYRTFSTVLSAGACTFSFYAKQGTKGIVRFDANAALTGTVDARANFDLVNGVLGTVDTGTLTASIVNAGSGWYRCIVSWTRVGATGASGIVAMSDTTSSAFGSNSTSGDFYIWGAQLEQRSSVTAYTVTTTQPITNYIPVLETAASGVARFDHNPTTFESLGLLIEQQSTNLVLQSQTFDSATWVKNGGGAAVTVIPNTIIAPDGTLTGDKLDEAGGVTQSQVILQGITVANSTAHTFSFYAKAAERSFVYTQVQGAGNFQVVFNLTTGTVGVSSGTFTSATITPVGNNWYRCAVTATSTTTTFNWYIEPQSTNALGTHLGIANNGIFLWGAQVEATAFSTSYIATVASQVTRAADSASMTGTNFTSWFNNAEGTVYSEAKCTNNPSINFVGAFSAVINDTNNYIDVARYQTTLKAFVVASGASQVSFDTGLTSATAHKVAVAYKTNDFALSADGATVLTDTVGIVPTVNRLYIGSVGADYFLNGTIKKIAYYPLRLSNTNLQALTG